MKPIIALCFVLCFALRSAYAQTDGDEPLSVRVLALDTSVAIAKRFCEKMVEFAPGYKLAFIDNEKRYFVRYVYKNENNESLRIDYSFDIINTDSEDGKQTGKRTVVTTQSISAELQVLTRIYNFLFAANFTPDRLLASSTTGSPVSFNGQNFEYTLLPDDFYPGYWVLGFRK